LRGVALAVALDFRVMARDAHMHVPEIGLGMNMSWQSVPRMLHLMGPARTKQAVILANASRRPRPTNGGWWRRWLNPMRSMPRWRSLASHMDVDQFALAS
jgi:hypothetical protein